MMMINLIELLTRAKGSFLSNKVIIRPGVNNQSFSDSHWKKRSKRSHHKFSNIS